MNPKPSNKILGIDFGLKRCGIAISDIDQEIALGRSAVSSSGIYQFLENIVKDEKIGIIVVGLPLNLKAQDTNQTKIVRNFTDQLKTMFPDVEIVLRDERYTSKAAQKIVKKGDRNKGNIDIESAVLILQGYLDEISSFSRQNS